MKALINDSLVKKLQPPTERRYEITWDSKLPSFGVCITSGGTVSFLLDYRVQQKHRRVKLGRYPALSVAAAREKAKNWQGQVTEKKDPGVKQQANGQPTMMQLADEYLQEHAKENKRAGSIRNDKGILDNIIRPKLGSYTVASITRRDIDKLHKSRSSTPYHANRMLSLLSTMFTCAIAWGYRKDNPARHVKRFDEHTKERWLSEEELKRFSVALNAYRDQSEPMLCGCCCSLDAGKWKLSRPIGVNSILHVARGQSRATGRRSERRNMSH